MSKWTKFATKFYKNKKRTNKNYKFSDALKEAAEVYNGGDDKKANQNGGDEVVPAEPVVEEKKDGSVEGEVPPSIGSEEVKNMNAEEVKPAADEEVKPPSIGSEEVKNMNAEEVKPAQGGKKAKKSAKKAKKSAKKGGKKGKKSAKKGKR